MSDFAVSLIRTWTPTIVGFVLARLAMWGVQLDAQAAANLSGFLTALFAALYYLLARILEKKNPEMGKLLGVAKKIEYKETK